MGFPEVSADQVRSNIAVTDATLSSLVNGRSLIFGALEVPTLGELRAIARTCSVEEGPLSCGEVTEDVRVLHADEHNADAIFQVASQFNLLEMISPTASPEDGVGIYENDRTQGPACAIAGGAGTIYRNYFANVNGEVGQSARNQIDCLYDVGTLLGNDNGELWKMRNGYALPTDEGLREISRKIGSMTEEECDELRAALRIGIQWNTQVTLGDSRHTVTQAYCSALPVAYTTYDESLWAVFARLVLDAAYEATLCAAMANLATKGNRRVYLTLLGGGAFGNNIDWILSAIRRSLEIFADCPLEVTIVSRNRSNPRLRELFTDM